MKGLIISLLVLLGLVFFASNFQFAMKINNDKDEPSTSDDGLVFVTESEPIFYESQFYIGGTSVSNFGIFSDSHYDGDVGFFVLGDKIYFATVCNNNGNLSANSHISFDPSGRKIDGYSYFFGATDDLRSVSLIDNGETAHYSDYWPSSSSLGYVLVVVLEVPADYENPYALAQRIQDESFNFGFADPSAPEGPS